MRLDNGLPVTTTDKGVAAAISAFEAELLVYGQNASLILEGAAADPDCALGQALAAALHLFTLSPAGVAQAAPFIARADARAATATPRERALIAAIAAWHAGDPARAIRLHAYLAANWPRDLIAGKIAQFHLLNRGDFTAMRRLTGQLLAANPDRSHVLGMHAFALEQSGDLAEAERAGRTAAALAFDPWAEHAVAHVLDSHGRASDGVAWMRGRSDGWAACSSFLYTHNWWHTALFHIDIGDAEAALALFDARVWGVRKGYAQDQVNAVSLLARLEICGVRVGARWSDVADHLAGRTADHLNAFVDLHYLYGLARAGRETAVAELIASLDERAGRSSDPAWRLVAPLAGAALAAHARRRYALAADLMARARPRLQCLGGSHTQRDLFELVYLDSVMRADPTRTVPSSPPTSRWWRRLGLPVAPNLLAGTP